MITPFHIAEERTPIKLLFPKQFSLLWFSIVNVLIDIEVVYYFLTTGYPSHKFFHSILGVSIIGFGCFFLSVLFKQKKLPSFLGCIIGAYSHHAIDYFWYNWGCTACIKKPLVLLVYNFNYFFDILYYP